MVANKVFRVFRQTVFLLAFTVMASLASASIPTFAIDAPTQAYAGEPVTIIVHVSHSDQSGLHYVNDIKLFVNDELVKEWMYDKNTYIKNGLWNETTEVTLAGDAEIYATGCSTPGSSGFGCSIKAEKSLARITVILKPVEAASPTPTTTATTTAPEITRPTPTQAPAAPKQQGDNTLLWLAVGVIMLIAIAAFAFYAMRKKPRTHYPPHAHKTRKK